MKNNVYSVALIGGVCTGKSSFCRLFKDYDVTVISADEIVKELYQDPGSQQAIAELFQQDPSSELSLSHIRAAILSDEKLRGQLEAILHPRVFTEIAKRMSAVTTPYCVVEMPLYVEINCPLTFDRVLLIDAPENIQLDRLALRDFDLSEAKALISIQSTKDKRYRVADEVIWNTVDKRFLPNIVERLHQHYCVLSAM